MDRPNHKTARPREDGKKLRPSLEPTTRSDSSLSRPAASRAQLLLLFLGAQSFFLSFLYSNLNIICQSHLLFIDSGQHDSKETNRSLFSFFLLPFPHSLDAQQKKMGKRFWCIQNFHHNRHPSLLPWTNGRRLGEAAGASLLGTTEREMADRERERERESGVIRQQPFARFFYQQRARLVRFLVWHLADRPNWEPPTADFKSNRDGTAMKSKLQRRRLRCRHDAPGLLFFFFAGPSRCLRFLFV